MNDTINMLNIEFVASVYMRGWCHNFARECTTCSNNYTSVRLLSWQPARMQACSGWALRARNGCHYCRSKTQLEAWNGSNAKFSVGQLHPGSSCGRKFQSRIFNFFLVMVHRHCNKPVEIHLALTGCLQPADDSYSCRNYLTLIERWRLWLPHKCATSYSCEHLA
jgi:hypothetical protein